MLFKNERVDYMSEAYNMAHELAKIIEKEESYVKVKKLTKKVMKNQEHMKLIEDFRKMQFELQQKQMQGQKLEDEDFEETNTLYESLSKISDIKELIDAEERLSILFSDLNRILTGPLEKIYKKETSE